MEAPLSDAGSAACVNRGRRHRIGEPLRRLLDSAPGAGVACQGRTADENAEDWRDSPEPSAQYHRGDYGSSDARSSRVRVDPGVAIPYCVYGRTTYGRPGGQALPWETIGLRPAPTADRRPGVS